MSCSNSNDFLPFTWWGQRPVYLSAILALAGIASMILTALVMAIWGSPGLTPLIFTVGTFLDHLWLWTPATYVLVNPPSLWFLLTTYLLWSFGESVERHLGRAIFKRLVLLLVACKPVALGIIALFGQSSWPAMGLEGIEFGVFLAFATLYPTARISIIILTIEAWILAAAIVLIDFLICLAAHNWAGLFMLFVSVGTAVGYTSYETGQWTPSLNFWPKGKAKAVPRTVNRTSKKTRATESTTSNSEIPTREAIDAILDKISRTGIASLTPEEKRKLEIASKR